MKQPTVIVTIDGPAGAGKSTVARTLAHRLGFRFLDTGAMYRAVAYVALRDQWPLDDPLEVARRSSQLDLQIDGDQIRVEGRDVTAHLRDADVTDRIHYVADNPHVRGRLVQLQRKVAEGGSLVTEGRDQGTVVFPDAQCKFFLTATVEERARRRWNDRRRAGEDVELAEVVEAQQERDRRDRGRAVGALARADDAIVIQTDGKSLEEVVDELVAHVQRREQPTRPESPTPPER
jgi:CMP/dCMP kinase